MILDHQTARLLADHHHDWTDALGRAGARVRRSLGGRRASRLVDAVATPSPKSQEISNVRQA